MAFNKQKFFENLAKLAELLVKIAPLFAEDAPVLMTATGEEPMSPDEIESALLSSVSGYAVIGDGMYGGPMTEALLERAIASLGQMIQSNAAEAARLVDGLINKVIATP